MIRFREMIFPQYGYFTEESDAYDFVNKLEGQRRVTSPVLSQLGRAYDVVTVTVNATTETEICQSA
jgi:hypothetical protein